MTPREVQMLPALRYIMTITNEEVWFWASNLLGVVGEATDKKQVLAAINLMSVQFI